MTGASKTFDLWECLDPHGEGQIIRDGGQEPTDAPLCVLNARDSRTKWPRGNGYKRRLGGLHQQTERKADPDHRGPVGGDPGTLGR